MKTLVLITALCSASLFTAGMIQAAPTSPAKQVTPAWTILHELAATAKGKRKAVPQSIRKLGFKGGGGPARVQGNCTYGNDHISHCEDCEVDWDDLTMVCIANMICYDDKGKSTPCPQS
jgi:hypothetical protein